MSDVKTIHMTRKTNSTLSHMETSMTDTSYPVYSHRQDGMRRPGWFARAESFLDERGKGAWIAAMVIGFVFFWPVGLAILAYMIWSKRMFSKSCNGRAMSHGRHTYHAARAAMRPSGNTAFDAYKTDTLRRLEEEQANFEAFLERLREAKDKSEFDDFMNERAASKSKTDDSAPEPDVA